MIYKKFNQTFDINDAEIQEKVNELNYFNVKEDQQKRNELRSVIYNVYNDTYKAQQILGDKSFDFLLSDHELHEHVRQALIVDLAMQKSNMMYDA